MKKGNSRPEHKKMNDEKINISPVEISFHRLGRTYHQIMVDLFDYKS